MYFQKPPFIPVKIEDEVVKGMIKSLEDKIIAVEAIKIEEQQILVLGYEGELASPIKYHEIKWDRKANTLMKEIFENPNTSKRNIMKTATLGMYNLLPYQRKLKKRHLRHEQKINDCIEANLNELKKKINHINIYQGSIQDAERELEKEMEITETNNKQKFIIEDVDLIDSIICRDFNRYVGYFRNNFWMKVQAYALGADAIVNYQPIKTTLGSAIGTPVRFKKEAKVEKLEHSFA
jgi:hypothetical protein